MCDKDLSSFSYADAVDSATIQDRRVVFDAKVPLDRAGVPPILTVTTDQHSIQTCAVSFMRYHLRMGCEQVADPFHASWNATLEGVSRAGFTGVLTCGITIANLAYGPFHKSAFFRDINGGALDIAASMTVDDKLLNFLWQRIAKDRGLSRVEGLGPAARPRFWTSCRTAERHP